MHKTKKQENNNLSEFCNLNANETIALHNVITDRIYAVAIASSRDPAAWSEAITVSLSETVE